MSGKHELCDLHIVMKNSIDPWTIYDRLESKADYTLSDMKYGTPNQFKELQIITIDTNDSNYTLILAFRINTWASYYIDVIWKELSKIQSESIIGEFELHANCYTLTNQIFRGGVNNQVNIMTMAETGSSD